MARTEQNKSSRRFALVDVPDPQQVSLRFVYNFFTPDERTNSSGDPRIPGVFSNAGTQRLVNASTLNTEIPRYVELNYAPGTMLSFGAGVRSSGPSDNDLRDFKMADINDEEDITTSSFMTFIENDPDCQARTGEKLRGLSDLLGITFDDTEQTDKLANFLELERETLQPLLKPTLDTLVVNFSPDATEKTFYDKAASFTINSQLNVRTLDSTFAGEDDVSALSSTSERKNLSLASKQVTAGLSSNIDLGDLDIRMNPVSVIDADVREEPRLIGAQHVGYVIEKIQLRPDGSKISGYRILVRGTDNTRYLDDNIVYGSKYAYTVRNVYVIDCIVLIQGHNRQQEPRRVRSYVMSKPTAAKTVETTETTPPNEPDGVFYRFNYGRGRGLVMSWQMPAGRSRDTKFFQVFRRASIYEPFQCIAELNFDNSEVPTLRAEQVREDLVFYYPGPQTFFEDSTFDRDSKSAIYAVCAVDAHGLTSGYSAQTQVSFDRVRNEITLKNISKPGAPKQYPNFFIDPDLDDDIAVDSFTQDAIYDSGHTKVSVYFTPDAKIAKTLSGQKHQVFTTDQDAGKYKLHFINLDVQDSATVEMKIEELLN